MVWNAGSRQLDVLNAYLQAVTMRRDVSDLSRCGKPATHTRQYGTRMQTARGSFMARARRLPTLEAGARLRKLRELMMADQKRIEVFSNEPRLETHTGAR